MESASRVDSITKVLSAKLQSEELQKMKVYETSFQMAFFMHLQITVASKHGRGAHLQGCRSLAYMSPPIRSPKPGSQACSEQAETAAECAGRLAM